MQAIEICPLNILIGANGAGKSNLISSLGLLRALPELKLQEYGRHLAAQPDRRQSDPMTRLFVACEGRTEVGFVTEVLTSHLDQIAGYRSDVAAPNLGGHFSYTKMQKFILNLLRNAGSEDSVTTMIDLYGLPTDFPGRAEKENVAAVTREFRNDIGDLRFLPYLQRHEFEELILSDVSYLDTMYPNRKTAIRERKTFLAPGRT